MLQVASQSAAIISTQQKILAKYDAKLRRMCKVKASGKAGVTDDILSAWREGGTARAGLVKILADCSGNKAGFGRGTDKTDSQMHMFFC